MFFSVSYILTECNLAFLVLNFVSSMSQNTFAIFSVVGIVPLNISNSLRNLWSTFFNISLSIIFPNFFKSKTYPLVLSGYPHIVTSM